MHNTNPLNDDQHGLPGPDSEEQTLRTLAAIPSYQNWHSTHLPPHIRRWLRHATADQLRTAAADALLRLYRIEQAPPSP